MVGQISQLAIEILGPALVALAIWALHKVSKKFGIEASASLEKRVRSLVRSAINHADAWAKTMAEKPAGSDKKAAAVKFVIAALAKTGVKDFAKTKIEELVEAQLEFDKKVMPAKKAE